MTTLDPSASIGAGADAERAPSAGALLRRLAGWLLLGLALRLLLLPLFVHPDLVSVYDRVRLLDGGEFALADYSFQSLPILLHALWVKLCFLPLPDFSNVHWPDPTEGEIFGELARLASDPQFLVGLFAWKLPYALLDVACGWLIARAVPAAHARTACALWMLHPLALYTSAAFGKYETFMLVPLLLGCAALRGGRTERACVWIGLAGAMRIYPLLIAAPLVLAARGTLRGRLELAALVLAPLACELAGAAVGPSWGWIAAAAAAWIGWRVYLRCRATRHEWLLLALLVAATALGAPAIGARLFEAKYDFSQVFHHASFLRGAAPSAAESSQPSPFVIGYGLVCVWAHLSGLASSASERPRAALDAALLGALAFFGLSFFHPQYALLLCALVVLRGHANARLLGAHALQLIGLLFHLLAFPGGNTSVQLALPFAPAQIPYLPDPARALPAGLDSFPWSVAGRSLLVLGCAWMAFELVRARAAASALDSAAGAGQGRLALALGYASWPLAVALYLACVCAPGATTTRPFGPVIEQAAGGPNSLDFSVGGAAPAGLQIQTSAARPAGEALYLVQIYAEGGEPGKPVATLRLTREELYPGALDALSPGTLRLPLEQAHLDPQKKYRAVINREPEPARTTQRVQALERVGTGALVREAIESGWQRLRAARALGLPFGWLWVALLGLLLAAAALASRGSGAPG